MSFVNSNNANRPKSSYKKVIEGIIDDGVCPFCQEQLSHYHKNPILKENRHWVATRNMYPYEGTKHHILFISKKHITDISEVTISSWQSLQEIINSISLELKIKGGTIFMRFGDTELNGASVNHLHAHLVSPYRKKDRDPITIRVG